MGYVRPMTLSKQIISLFLALTLMSSAIPVFLSEDATQDCRIDLDDAILLTQRLKDTSENPSAFNFVFQQTITAMRIAANLKCAFAPIGKSSLDEKLSFTDLLYIIPSSSLLNTFYTDESIHTAGCCFQSLDPAPPCPPPRFV
jgi:hypothetical protein